MASLRERHTGLMVHSRAADLRKRGYTITCQVEGKNRKGRDRYVYRLAIESEPVIEPLQQMEFAS